MTVTSNQASNIEVKIGSVDDFYELSKLDYTNVVTKKFSIESKNLQISISEIDLDEPITYLSKSYTDEILEEMIPMAKKENFLPLMVFVDGQPVGYMLNEFQKWPQGKIMLCHGILVANSFARQGLAKALINKAIDIAKADPECHGIHAEMCTFKYKANNLLLRTGFTFAGAKFFVWKNEEPSANSKEAMYFYYKTN